MANEQARLGEASHPYSGNWTGIALSGGGVRSAIFGLGALQALALKEVLPKFDYMSTVSGGGYIGLSLQWFCRKMPKDECGKETHYSVSSVDFPFGTLHPDPAMKIGNATPNQQSALQYLRDNIGYLAPGGGITHESGILAVIRTVFLNLIIWIPSVSLIFLALLLASYIQLLASNTLSDYENLLPSPLPSIPVFKQADYYSKIPVFGLPYMFALLLWIVWVYLAAMVLFAIATLFVAHEKKSDNTKRIFGYLSLSMLIIPGMWLLFVAGTFSNLDKGAAIFMTAAGTIASIIAILFFYKHKVAPKTQLSYFMRRRFETGFAKYLNTLIVVVIIAFLPIIYAVLQGQIQASNYGLAGLIFGVGTALYGNYSSLKSLA
ncbi:MAG: patatin-like phospholipase family protein, partial [Usitatibacteraceae bacterium]